jgi:hypothetical protein
MGKHIVSDGEEIHLQDDTDVRWVKDYYGADDDTVLIYREDDGETTLLTDDDIVLDHIPNEAEVSLQPRSDQIDDDFHVIYNKEQYFVDPTETAGQFRDRIGAPTSDVLTFREEGRDDFSRLDDNVVLADNVENGAIIATLAGDEVYG